MNKIRKSIMLMCLLLLIGMLFGCKPVEKYKEKVSFDGVKAQVEKEVFVDDAHLILKGTVTDIAEPYFTNPDGDKKNADGSKVVNAYVTVYTLKVDEVYKGEWENDTIAIKVYNRKFMTVGQALYGEDDNTIVTSSIPDVTMKMGECVVGLDYFDEPTFGEEPCYNLFYGAAGYFLPQEDGTYVNQTDLADNKFTFTLAELQSMD